MYPKPNTQSVAAPWCQCHGHVTIAMAMLHFPEYIILAVSVFLSENNQ